MNNKELKIQFDQTLKPLGYKKTGNIWITKTEELTKIIELQKSGYSNSYYVNFHVNFNQLDGSEKASHIFNRHDQVLDLDPTNNDLHTIADEALRQIIEELNRLITVEDARKYVKSLPTLNILPLKVKEFLNTY